MAIRQEPATDRAARRAGQPATDDAYEPGLSGAPALVIMLIVYVAALPMTSHGLGAFWLAAMVAMSVARSAARRMTDRALGARIGSALQWMQTVGFVTAATAFMAHPPIGYVFGVSLYGCVLFRLLGTDHADPRRLAAYLAPLIVGVGVADTVIARNLIAAGRSAELFTELAAPTLVVFAFIQVYLDIRRARRQAEAMSAAAAQSRRDLEGFSRLVDLSESVTGVGHWRHDAESRTVTWSPGIYQIYGVDPSSRPLVLDEVLAFYEPAERAAIRTRVTAAVRDGEPYRIEARVRRANGEYRHVVSSAAAERDADGRITAVVGVITDVTEARQREQALRDQESRFRHLAEHFTDLVVWYAPDGTLLYASPSVRLLGWDPDAVLGRNTLEFVHPDDRERMADNTRRSFETGAAFAPDSRDYRFFTADGEIVWLESNPTFILAPDGTPESAITSLRDVTVRRRQEADLIDAKVRAEAAAEAKSEFLANMSHEIRTPLTGILGFADLLAREPDLSPRSASHVARIRSSGRSLLAIVNDILDFSKLEAGQLTLNPAPFALRPLLEDAISVLGPSADAKGLALTLEIDPAIPETVIADRARLEQILVNLVGNAVKFTDFGRVTVRLQADAGWIITSVEDTGPGIAEDRLHQLFHRFSQIDGSIGRRHGGTGLGLSICKALADRMGGEISVESALGAGSIFTLRVPAEAVCDAPADRAAAQAEADGPSAAPLRVLVVDDLEINRELIRAILEAVGHDIDEAESGSEAIRAAIMRPYDVILMDLQMPGMDGLAAARAIRGLSGPNQGAPILALSANVLPEHVDASLAAGMDGHIAKPISPADLLHALAAVSARDALAVEDARERA